MNNPPPSSSSSRPATFDADDVTWLEFLRTAGGTVPDQQPRPHTGTTSTSSSQERKRRHAGSSPERRGYPYPPQYYAGSTDRRPFGMSVEGNTRDNAVDLISPSPPPPPQPHHRRPHMPQQRPSSSLENARAARPGMRSTGMGSNTVRGPASSNRRDSDFVLPRWQPDAEVNKCPVCQTEFHFFYRKHHCRKCGRVVCAACSPHRITIPRQYIVQPTTGYDGDELVAPLSPNGGGNPFARNLGGGEIVRVCNPCVPDPWTPEAAAASASEARSRGDDDGRRRPSEHGQMHPDRYRNMMAPGPTLNEGRIRTHPHQPGSTHFSRSVPQHPPTIPTHAFTRLPPAPPNPPRVSSHRYSQSGGSSAAAATLPSQIPSHLFHPLPPAAPSAPPPPRRRREVREEDECPVCGVELPPGDALRESHIQDCIASRFSTSTPGGTSSSLPTHPPSASLPRAAAAAHPTPNLERNNSASATSRPRAGTSSYRPRGMAVYRATEKDCVNEDGEAVECVICFEEFQPGDEMGRMECLCKFHRACIRRWWEARGEGGVSCPTHQLHE